MIPHYKFFKFFIIILFIALPIESAISSEEKNLKKPQITMGMAITYGYYDVIHDYGEGIKWEGDYGYGCGLIFEKKITNLFGIHSGIWYSKFTVKFTEPDHNDYPTEGTIDSPEESSGSIDPPPDPDNTTRINIKNQILTIPIYLITSIKFRTISVCLLTGFNFAHITKSLLYFHTTEDMTSGNSEKHSKDSKKYIEYIQLGIAGGVEIKFPLSRFVDIFFSGIAEKYFTDVIKEATQWNDYLYDYRVICGFLFRTF